MKGAFFNNRVFRIVWPLLYGEVIYLLILLLNNDLGQLKESFFGQELYFCILLSYLIFEANRFVLIIDVKRKTDDQSAFRIVSVMVINLILTTFLIFTVVSVYFTVILGFSSINTFSTELATFILIYLATSLIYNGLVISNQYLFKENENLLQNERILAENLELELMKFKNDVNPELLYDSLESLISLIHKNSNEAEDHIDRLALVYRHILSNKNNEVISISQEMQAVKSIISLMNEKFNNCIQMNHPTEDKFPEFFVIPGAITNTIETVIRKTIITQVQPLDIYFDFEEEGYFIIRHKLNDRLSQVKSSNMQELQNAYSIFTEKPVVSVKAYGENYIKIPILHLEEEPA